MVKKKLNKKRLIISIVMLLMIIIFIVLGVTFVAEVQSAVRGKKMQANKIRKNSWLYKKDIQNRKILRCMSFYYANTWSADKIAKPHIRSVWIRPG